jgi:hypothetical protein
MATIVTRAGKGSPLTNNEVDANFNNLNTAVTSRTINKAGASGTTSTYAVARNPLTAGGQERIIAGRDFGLALDGSTDDAPALNDIIQKVGARGGGVIDIAADLTPGGSAYMKTLSTINNNVTGVTVRGTNFPYSSEFLDDPLAAPSGVLIVPGFNGIACYHFTPFSSTAPQVVGGGFEYLSVIGGKSGSGSSQELLRVDGVGRGSYIMNLLTPAGPTCARFIARDPAYISSISNTSIQYAHVDLFCKAYPAFAQHPNANPSAHGVIMQTSETFADASAGRSGNVSLNRDWRIVFQGINGKALWNRSGDANVGFSLIGYQAGQPGVNELIWGSTGSGGTSGTYTMSFSGGTAISGYSIVAPTGTFTVAGGKITSYTFTTTGSGYEKTAAPPTVSFAACPGLSGASATCVIGVILYHADAAAKSKASYLGGQSQGFAFLSGQSLPIILEGTNAPSAGALYSIGNGSASSIAEGFIDSGNGTPQPTVGTQAFAKTRDMVYTIDYGLRATGPVFGTDQLSTFYAKSARSATAPFTSTSYNSGIGAEFLMGSNTLDLRLEDDATGVVRWRDPLGVLTKTSFWSSLQALGGLEIQPTIGATWDPTANGRMTFEATSNTQAYIKVQGSDGVIRKAGLPLSVSGASGSGTVTSVAALTLGTSGTDLSSSVATSTTTPVITLNVPTASASARGVLSAADWSTFNSKQATLSAASASVSGYLTNTDWSTFNGKQSSGAAASFTSLAYSTTLTGGTGVINIGSGQIYKDASGNLGIGTVSPGEKLSIAGVANVFMSLLSTGVIKTQFYAADATGTGGIGTVTNHAFTINANNAEKMRVEANGNVGIGVTPNTSALLDVQSTTKGVRFPNMTTTEKNAITSPALGLVVFDTTLAKLCVYTGAWQTITSV